MRKYNEVELLEAAENLADFFENTETWSSGGCSSTVGKSWIRPEHWPSPVFWSDQKLFKSLVALRENIAAYRRAAAGCVAVEDGVL